MKLYVFAGLHYAPKERFITRSIEEMKDLPKNTTMEILYKSETTDVFVGESGATYLNFPKPKLEQLDGSIPDTVEFPETLKKGTWDEMFKLYGTMLSLNSRIIHKGSLWLNEATNMESTSQMFAKVPMGNDEDILFYKNFYMSISKRLISTSLTSISNALPNDSSAILIELNFNSGFVTTKGEYFVLENGKYVKGGRLKHINFPFNYIDIHGKNDVEITLMFKQYTDSLKFASDYIDGPSITSNVSDVFHAETNDKITSIGKLWYNKDLQLLTSNMQLVLELEENNTCDLLIDTEVDDIFMDRYGCFFRYDRGRFEDCGVDTVTDMKLIMAFIISNPNVEALLQGTSIKDL